MLTLTFGFQTKSDASYKDMVVTIKSETITSPIIGRTVSLSDVNEPLFATNMVGRGVAIEPAEGKVYAPANGVVTTLFPSQHAIAITSNSGAEILIHIGIDTVNLKGQYFRSLVKQEDKVEQN